MSERLQGIEAFVTSVEAGNFALAAQRLQKTRSAVAKSVARLEERLGTRLFLRTTRSQTLTEDGQAYYERCRRALAELDAATNEVEAGRRVPRGRLRITMPHLIGRALVAPLLMELAQEHDELNLEIIYSDRVFDLAAEGIDLALRSGPLGNSAVLAARSLGHQWMGVYASPGYLRQREQPESFEELLAAPERHAFVGYMRESAPHSWRFHDASGQLVVFEVPEHARFKSNFLESSLDAAVHGLGITRIPHWLAADAVRAGTLVQVFDEPQPFGYELHAIWLQGRSMPLKTRVAIDCLVQRMPSLLGLKTG